MLTRLGCFCQFCEVSFVMLVPCMVNGVVDIVTTVKPHHNWSNSSWYMYYVQHCDDSSRTLQTYIRHPISHPHGRAIGYLVMRIWKEIGSILMASHCVYCIYKARHQRIRHSWCMSYRDHSVYAPSQWEMALQCNAISHWLSACTEWSLFI